jgi:hypothetical protein
MTSDRYSAPTGRVALHDRLEERLRRIPLLAGAAMATSPPGTAGSQRWLLALDGLLPDPERPRTTAVKAVGDDYFETLGLPLVAGRPFSRLDGTPGHAHAIVNERFVSLFLDGGGALDRRVELQRAGGEPWSSGWLSIVGVAPTVRERNVLLQHDLEPAVYLPFRSLPSPSAVLVVRGLADQQTVVEQVRAELLALDPDLPLFDVQSLDSLLAFFRWPQRVFGGVLAMLASMALLLAAVGLAGITAYAVVQRTRDLGIRIALGARPARIMTLVVRQALAPLAAGFLVGSVGAFSAGQLLRDFLAGVDPRDPATLVIVAGILTSAGLLAAMVPARRVLRLDPVAALRHE